MHHYWKLLLFVFFLASCADKPTKEDQLLEEAFTIHKEAVTIESAVREQMKNGSILDSSLASIKSRLDQWSSNLIEVPGYEHDHDHDHEGHDHHHHDHSAPVDVTAEHMVGIQQEFLDTIQAIKRDLEAYLGKFN